MKLLENGHSAHWFVFFLCAMLRQVFTGICIYLIGKNFVGQSCQNVELVPKIFSAEKFCPPKFLSAENLSDKEYGWVNSLTITLSILWLEMEKFRFNSMNIFELLIMRSLCMNKNITGAMHGVGFFEIIMMKTIHYFIHVPTWSVFQWIWSFSHHLLFNTIFESLKFAE